MSHKGKKEEESYPLKPISVIICARNEEHNVLNFVPKILNQDYPEFEVVLINDRSWDETFDVMDALAQKDKRIKLVNIPDAGKDGFAKKFALTIGIKAAKHERLVFIDADCYPVSDQWLKEMGSKFGPSKSVVLGLGSYEKRKGFLNKLIRFETLQIAHQYLSFAKAGIPYMGVGRNLGYKKELYDSIRGFKNHYHVKSGDDDLFVNNAATKQNTNICFGKDSYTLSIPEQSFKDYTRQKRRHLTTGRYYKKSHKILLALWSITSILFFYFSIATIIVHPLWYLPASILVLRIILQYTSSYRVYKEINGKDVFILLPLLEWFMMHVNAVLLVTNKTMNKQI